MKSRLTKREFLQVLSAGAATIALVEAGWAPPARAETAFIIGSAGGSWGKGLHEAYAVNPGFIEKYGVTPLYDQPADSVAAGKAIAQCGNPPFSTASWLNNDAVLVAEGGCLEEYNLDLLPNYAALLEGAKEPPRAGLRHWWGAHVMLVLGLTWNTKHVTQPTSMQDLLNRKYKGRVGIPSFRWIAVNWLHSVNKVLGGNEDNIDPAIAFAAELRKKNDAIVIENTDHALKAFTREEIVMMPFWNGRTFALQEAGVPVQIEYVKGSLQMGNGFPILKGTKFRELAHRFINNTMDGRFQLEMTQRFRYPPTNKNVQLPPKMAHYGVPSNKLGDLIGLDYAKIQQNKSAHLERWNKEVIG
jgi:putative spermidine/putrescine transport system substrate-binding protein